MTGTPQGGIASPLLANIALSALDRQYQADWQEMSRYQGRRQYLQRTGHPTYRLIRYADDLVLLVWGTREQAQTLLDAAARAGSGARPEAQGREDRDHPHRRRVRVPRPADPSAGTRRTRPYVYTFVTNEALASIRRKVKALTGRSTTNMELSELIAALNPVLRGWASYYRHAAAKRTFDYLGYYVWWRVGRWLRKKHPRMSWKEINRRYGGKDGFHDKGIVLYTPAKQRVTRYRYRGATHPHPVDPRRQQLTRPARKHDERATRNSS